MNWYKIANESIEEQEISEIIKNRLLNSGKTEKEVGEIMSKMDPTKLTQEINDKYGNGKQIARTDGNGVFVSLFENEYLKGWDDFYNKIDELVATKGYEKFFKKLDNFFNVNSPTKDLTPVRYRI
jgi:hypothetical protein